MYIMYTYVLILVLLLLLLFAAPLLDCSNLFTCAQGRCHPQEASYLPTFSHLLIVNKLLSLSLSLFLLLHFSLPPLPPPPPPPFCVYYIYIYYIYILILVLLLLLLLFSERHLLLPLLLLLCVSVPLALFLLFLLLVFLAGPARTSVKRDLERDLLRSKRDLLFFSLFSFLSFLPDLHTRVRTICLRTRHLFAHQTFVCEAKKKRKKRLFLCYSHIRVLLECVHLLKKTTLYRCDNR